MVAKLEKKIESKRMKSINTQWFNVWFFRLDMLYALLLFLFLFAFRCRRCCYLSYYCWQWLCWDDFYTYFCIDYLQLMEIKSTFMFRWASCIQLFRVEIKLVLNQEWIVYSIFDVSFFLSILLLRRNHA